MRIIAGEFRSRRLLTPRDDSTTRPIPDRVKESLFGLLRGHCEGANVFDGFAGTGALGLEAVSRGAARCVLVEKDRDAAEMLRRNIDSLGVQDRCELVVGDALGAGALARAPRPVTLAFLDPPYAMVTDPVGWKRVKAQLEQLVRVLSEDGMAVVRTPWPFKLETRREAPVAVVRRKAQRPTRRQDWTEERWRGAASRDPADSEPEAKGEPAPQEAGVERMPADMAVPGAAGPETHVYHAMAVHLYMKARHEGTEAQRNEGETDSGG